MRELRVGLLGGLAALLGYAGAARANAVATLTWQSTGSSFIAPNSIDIITLVVLIGFLPSVSALSRGDTRS